MTVAAVAMVRDEADIIEQTIGQMLTQVDTVIVADNGSIDGTREILERLDVAIIEDHEPGYYQSQKMTRLAHLAADAGADWVVPFDADEWWYSPFGRIADVLAEHPEALIAPAILYDHVATGEDLEGPPTERIGWRRTSQGELPKVACKPRPSVTVHQGNHAASYGTALDGQLVIRHFPYRSPQQFERKVRNGAQAYAATNLPEHEGQHWRGYGRILDEEGPEALAGVFHRWFWHPHPQRSRDLIFDPVAELVCQ